MHHRFAWPRLEQAQKLSVPTRLAVIDPSLPVDGHEDVLIDEPHICVGGFDVTSRSSFDVPRSRRQEHFPWYGFEGTLEPGLKGVTSRPRRLAGRRRHVAGIESPELIDAGAGRCHERSPYLLAVCPRHRLSNAYAPIGVRLRQGAFMSERRLGWRIGSKTGGTRIAGKGYRRTAVDRAGSQASHLRSGSAELAPAPQSGACLVPQCPL